MISFITAIILLVLGYFIYGRLVEKIFHIDSQKTTPAYTLRDNVDFVPMKTWRAFLIQFLNIAGLGPIFGAISGAMFGPSAFLWIVLGCIFAGGVHDYFSGMLSLRHKGLSISEVVGFYLGPGTKKIIRIFTIMLLIFVGTVFLVGPAKIIHTMTGGDEGLHIWMWVLIIMIYYILSTILPIDKIISKLYPIFGAAMLFMALGLFIALIFDGYKIPEVNWINLRNMSRNPEETPIFPILFVTIACGAISGFHATQSPMISRCLNNEKNGRKVFYGAMIAEGIVTLIWAAAAMVFFGSVEALNVSMAENQDNAAWAANEIAVNMLGSIGGMLALIGIVIAPITSGDTAFRSARLIIGDSFSIQQRRLMNRLYISIPLFIVAFVLTQLDFAIIWRYFAWSNQTLAMVVLWAITAYLYYNNKFYWMTLIPAVFMTMVCSTYILLAPEGFQLQADIAYLSGGIITVLILVLFWRYVLKRKASAEIHLL